MRRNKWLAWLLIVSLFVSTFMTNGSVALASVVESIEVEQAEISDDIILINKKGLSAAIDAIDNSALQPKLLSKSYVRAAYDHAKVVVNASESDQVSVDVAQSELEHATLLANQLELNLAYIVGAVPNPTFGTGGGEWSILSLARADYNVPEGYYDIYYGNVEKEVTQLMVKNNGVLHKHKGTEHTRLMLGLTSIGKNIYDVAGYDISSALADFNYVIKQGINGPIFALIGLNTHQYPFPFNASATVQSTEEMFIQFILDKEIKKDTDSAGGWALSGTTADPDITGMAMQALAPYYESNANVREAIDRAVSWLSTAQIDTGGYKSWGTENAESTAQVIVALTALGIDPHADNRFVKNGSSAIDALMTYAVPTGGFKHILSMGIDGMATDQGTYALVAYERFLEGKTALYDMTDVVMEKEETLDTPGIKIKNDGKPYEIAIIADDKDKEIAILIHSRKIEPVRIHVTPEVVLPAITAKKGNVSIAIAKDTKVESNATSSIELLTFPTVNTALSEQLNTIITADRKLEDISYFVTMGGSSRVDFSEFVTMTLARAAGQDAAYIQENVIHPIIKFATKDDGIASGLHEFAYDSGDDLVIETNHFTDFVTYSTITIDQSGGGSGDGGNSSNPGNGGVTTPTVTLSVDKLTIDKGYVISPITVELQSGDTAWSVLKRVLDNKSIGYDSLWTEKYNSIYVQSIAGDGEFDHGEGSGWMYNVNAIYPNYGASLYTLQGGDSLQWRYTTNLGEDLGQKKWETDDSTDDGSAEGGAPDDSESANPEDDEEQTTKPSIKELYSDYNTISAWAVDAIQQATNEGFVGGSKGKFNPKSSISRAEFTKILVSLLNLETDVEQAISFTDVASKDWFYPYINVAFKNGLINGYNNTFNPQSTITREEMAVIIARALKLTTGDSTSSIKDSDKVSAWAKLDVEAVVALGIMAGDATGFNPQAEVTREMAAVVAVRSYLYEQDATAYKKSLEATKINNQLQKTASFLQDSVTDPIIASIGGDWTVFGLARSGQPIDPAYYANYYGNVVQTLTDNAGKLHNVKYTEYDRVILALTALGKDIKNVAGYDLRKPLADYETVIKQGINGPIFALIALDSKNYEIATVEGVKTQTTRELLIQFILDREIAGGGWALGSNAAAADPDITAMAIQGLTPYYKADVKVKAAVDRGLTWLSHAQQSDGGFASWGVLNSESIAQVIVALTGLGINPDQDARFIKNGQSAVDALLEYAASNGGFYHVKTGGEDNGGAKPGKVDLMATDQAFYALSSYERYLTNKNRLYDMKDVK